MRRKAASYDWKMPRVDVHLKVELDLPNLDRPRDSEKPERVAAEICRMIRRVYGVRSAEISSIIEKDS